MRAAYPGYTGSRPRMMLWHGTAYVDLLTAQLKGLLKPYRDTTLYYPNYGEEIKEWTNVFNVSQTPTSTVQNDPQSGYTMTLYGPNVVGFSAQGVGHTVPVHETIDLAFFGITGAVAGSPPVSGSGSGTGTGSTTVAPPSSPTTSSTPPSSSAPAAGTVAHYGQCGG